VEAEAGAERVGVERAVERAVEIEATAERFALIRALRKLMQSSGMPKLELSSAASTLRY
jgi:hypothetical protein